MHLSASSCRRGGNVRRVSLAAAAGTVEQQQRTVLQLGGRSGCRNGDSSEQQQTQASVVPQPSLAIDGRTIATWHPRQGYQAEHTAIHRVNVFPVRTGLLPPAEASSSRGRDTDATHPTVEQKASTKTITAAAPGSKAHREEQHKAYANILTRRYCLHECNSLTSVS